MKTVSVENELKAYAQRKALGQASEGDDRRVVEIGIALNRDVSVPQAAVPVKPPVKVVAPKLKRGKAAKRPAVRGRR